MLRTIALWDRKHTVIIILVFAMAVCVEHRESIDVHVAKALITVLRLLT